MQKYLIIAAGGLGTRMNSPLAKQFVLLEGKPIIFHALEVFIHVVSGIHVIIVLPKQYMRYWSELCKEYCFTYPHEMVESGAVRFYSVLNGLGLVKDENALVAIHDGVRPLVNEKTIVSVFEHAAKYGNAIPVVNPVESVRILNMDTSQPIDRTKVLLVQTPQVFLASIIKKAYRQTYCESFTDDATVAESSGVAIHHINGNIENIKITTPEDLIFAKAIMQSRF